MQHEALKRRVCDQIDESADDLVDLVADLVDEQTVGGNEAPGQAVVIDRLESMGLVPDVFEADDDQLRGHPGFFETAPYLDVGYEGRPNVVATIEGAGDGNSIALSGHIDVVPAASPEWSSDPFTLRREDDRLYGRGTADMKGGLAACLEAGAALQALDVSLAGDVILQSTIEEEDGGVGGILATLERGYQPDAAIIAEPWGVPHIGMASAGVRYFELTVSGKSAHVGYGYEGVNALDKAMAVYGALRELDEERKARIDYEPAYRLEPRMRGHETNLNIGMIEAGDWPATIPGSVTMTGRLGWPPGEEPDEVIGELEAAIDAVADEDEWLREHPPELSFFGLRADPHEIDPTAPFPQTAMANAEWVTGREGTFHGGSAGNDTRFYKRYYDIPAISMGPEANNIHGADEHVTVPSLLEAAKSIACTAIDHCGVVD